MSNDLLKRVTALEVAVARLMSLVSAAQQAAIDCSAMDVDCAICGAVVGSRGTCQDSKCPCGLYTG